MRGILPSQLIDLHVDIALVSNVPKKVLLAPITKEDGGQGRGSYGSDK